MPTFNDDILVTTTGLDVGSQAARVDLFARNIDVSGTFNITGMPYFNVKNYGATGNGTTDDTAAINTAMAAAVAGQGVLFFPVGTYLISSTLTITEDAGKYARFAIIGEAMNTISNSAGMPGVVIKTATNITAIQTPVPSPTTLGGWIKNLYISDITVSGPQAEGSASTTSCGFLFQGVQYLRTFNIHAEGFGYGVAVRDGSEILMEGQTFVENNYYGAEFKRSNTSTMDLQVWINNLMTVNNDIPLRLDNVRTFWHESGENITYGASGVLLGRPATTRIQIVNCSNSQIFFNSLIAELDENIEFCNVDSSGVSQLLFDQCNFESFSFLTIVKCQGFFDAIRITNTAFPRSSTGLQLPLVNLTASGTSDANLRANNVILESNSPAWFDFYVRNDMVSRDILHDFAPRGFQQVSQRRELDQANDNHFSIVGNNVANANYAFTNSNVQVGNGRLYFTAATPTNNLVKVLFPRVLRGASILYVTALVDDNSGATVPTIDDVGDGTWTSPTDWQLISYSKLGSYTVGARTFTKYGFSVSILNKTKSNSATALQWVRLGNIYSSTTNVAGVEFINVYANTHEVGYVDPTLRTMTAAPAATTDGYHSVGQLIYNNTPAASGYLGWVCTAAGTPGTWDVFGPISSTSTAQDFTFSTTISNRNKTPKTDITLANGANSDIALGGAEFCRIVGPTGVFSVSGFASGEDGRTLVLFNSVAFAMTITNEATSTAANRITTLTGADVVLRAGKSSATFKYDSGTSRWILISQNG